MKNVYNEGIVGFGAMVYKYEEISGNKTPLKGVQFTISHYTAQNGPQSATPTATWVLETDENGEISTYTADKHLISGDPLYRNAANAVVCQRLLQDCGNRSSGRLRDRSDRVLGDGTL